MRMVRAPSGNASIDRSSEWRISNDEWIISQTKGHCWLSRRVEEPGVNTRSVITVAFPITGGSLTVIRVSKCIQASMSSANLEYSWWECAGRMHWVVGQCYQPDWAHSDLEYPWWEYPGQTHEVAPGLWSMLINIHKYIWVVQTWSTSGRNCWSALVRQHVLHSQ
jgi:hypothetical protein